MIPWLIYGYFKLLRCLACELLSLIRGATSSLRWLFEETRYEPVTMIPVWGVSIGMTMLVLTGQPQWFLNWPAMLGCSILLYAGLRWPLSSSPLFLQKTLKLTLAACVTLGIILFLKWRPFTSTFGLTSRETFWPWLAVVIGFWVAVAWTVFPQWFEGSLVRGPRSLEGQRIKKRVTFADVGGLEEAKHEIRKLVAG